MPNLKWRVHLAPLFAVFLSACLGNSQTPAPSSLTPASPPAWTSTPAQMEFSIEQSALAYGIFETEATSVTVEVYNTTPDGVIEFADISIEDGSGVHTYKLQSGDSSVVHSLPAGRKQVTVTSGGLAKRNNEVKGVFIRKIIFDQPAVQLQPATKRVVVYGDSLASGGRVENPSAEAWPVLLREQFSVSLEAYGYRMLYDDAKTPEDRSIFASQITASAPDMVWLAIGANDYGMAPWSAQAFGKAYAATLDALHAASPQAVLFAQSPIRQIVEPPNSFGDDFDAYREQIAGACAARSGWCVFVDGKDPAFPQPDELDEDGTHLTRQSSIKYAEAVRNFLNKQ